MGDGDHIQLQSYFDNWKNKTKQNDNNNNNNNYKKRKKKKTQAGAFSSEDFPHHPSVIVLVQG